MRVSGARPVAARPRGIRGRLLARAKGPKIDRVVVVAAAAAPRRSGALAGGIYFAR